MMAQTAWLLYHVNRSATGANLQLNDFLLTKETPAAAAAPAPQTRRSLAPALEAYFLGAGR